MTMRLFVPRDAGAVAVGADEVALALEQAAAKRGIAVEIVRTGSRGLYWLEPMVEVATPQGPHRVRPGDTGRGAVRARCHAPPTARIRCGLVSRTRFPGSSARPG